MAKWNRPEIEELGIEATEHNWFGKYSDGGYIGDGVLSGHSTNTKPAESTAAPNATPTETPVDALS